MADLVTKYIIKRTFVACLALGLAAISAYSVFYLIGVETTFKQNLCAVGLFTLIIDSSMEKP